MPATWHNRQRARHMEGAKVSNEILPQVFDNPEFGQLRVIQDEDGEPWFVAKDVCDALGIRTDTIRSILDEDEVDEISNPNSIGVTHGRAPLIVSEAGLYSLVLKSRKPEARAFKRWVTHDVLPKIRRTGGYVPTTPADDEKTILAKAVLIGQRTMEEQKAVIARQGHQIDVMEPKAGFYDSCMAGERWMSVTEAARLLRQYDRTMTRKKVDAILMDTRVMTRDRQASAVGIERGYLRNYQPPARFDQQSGQMVRPKAYAKVTSKGLDWLVRRFCGQEVLPSAR